MVNTNDCLVLSQTMTRPMRDAYARAIHIMNPLCNTNVIDTTKEYYIRKADGIILGYYIISSDGTFGGDHLCDWISTNAIPDSEFFIPGKASAIRHTNWLVDVVNPEVIKRERATQRRSMIGGAIGVVSMIALVFLVKALRRSRGTLKGASQP